MPGPTLTDWTTPAAVQQIVCDVLKIQPNDLRTEDAERLASTVAKAIVKAEADLVPLLTAKGYTLTLLGAWHHRHVVLTDQAVFRALIAQDALSNAVGEPKIKEFDWRETIKDKAWQPTGADGKAIAIPNGDGGGSDGQNLDGQQGPDLFGGSQIAVGRFFLGACEINRDTKF